MMQNIKTTLFVYHIIDLEVFVKKRKEKKTKQVIHNAP